jgi:predicted AlkP superfamily pyrophosphatase or phosphodiesterase
MACTGTPTSKNPARADARWSGGWRLIAALVLTAAATAVSACGGHAQASPIVVLISFDGWRWDYTDRAEAPNLRALAARGIRSDGLIPSFPSKTFPNHYTLVTGLHPEHHGIISNTMWDEAIGERFTMSAPTARDPRWWSGEPLWATAIRQGRRASSMFWPGAEVEIGGIRPTAWLPYDDDFPNDDRVTQVIDWLKLPEAERPSFITLYFSDVDTAGHTYGPDAPETMAAAARVDGLFGNLVAGLATLGLEDRVHFVVVSDHGMSQQALDRKIFLDDYVDLSTVDVVDWTPVLAVRPRQGSVEELYAALKNRHPALTVYRREEMPAHLHYSSNPRIPPVLGLAAEGWAITSRERFARTRDDRRHMGGDHGYDGRERVMHGLFVAAGPRLRQGVVVPPFENVHVYELLCRLLDLTPAPNDGDPAVTESWLRR